MQQRDPPRNGRPFACWLTARLMVVGEPGHAVRKGVGNNSRPYAVLEESLKLQDVLIHQRASSPKGASGHE